MKSVSLIVTLLLIQNNCIAKIYKCKQKDGAIKFSSQPCSKDSISEKVIDFGSKKKSKAPKRIIPLDKIKTASDGLSQIRVDGFGSYSLKDIKVLLKKGEKIEKIIHFTGKDHWGDNYLEIYSYSNNRIDITYTVDGMNYAIYDKKDQIKMRKDNDNDQSTYFNVTLEDVNNHAISMGFKGKKFFPDTGTSWKWEQDGFNCELSASIQQWITPHHLIYDCAYEAPQQ